MLKRTANSIPTDILLVAKIQMPPRRVSPAQTEKIMKKT
jgi:hypothetical protein